MDLGEKTEEELEGSVKAWDGRPVPSAPLMPLLSKERHFEFQKVIRVTYLYLALLRRNSRQPSGTQVLSHSLAGAESAALPSPGGGTPIGELGFPQVRAPQPPGCCLSFGGSLPQSSVQNEPDPKKKEKKGLSLVWFLLSKCEPLGRKGRCRRLQSMSGAGSESGKASVGQEQRL